MGKQKSMFVCSQCGFETAKWFGKCPSCGEWNTLNEEVVAEITAKTAVASVKNMCSLKLKDISVDNEHRYHTGVGELDRVLGGGIVKGSLILLGGGQSAVALIFTQVRPVGHRDPAEGCVVAGIEECLLHLFGDDV